MVLNNNSSFDFDLSIILPFYKKLNDFKRVLPNNAKYYARRGIEVVIAMDEPKEEKELFKFIKKYDNINWRIIVNENYHEWRNPAKCINVGIRKSIKKYILVMSPESELFNDAIYILRNRMDYYKNHYATGVVTFLSHDEKFNFELPRKNYGSILVEKEYLYKIGGYNENLQTWGGDDDNLRARLNMCGLHNLTFPDAILIHRENTYDPLSRSTKYNYMDFTSKKLLFLPITERCNKDNWGYDFNKVIYDWQNI